MACRVELDGLGFDHARGLRAGTRHIGIVHSGVPRRPSIDHAIADCRSVALDAKIDWIQVGKNTAVSGAAAGGH